MTFVIVKGVFNGGIDFAFIAQVPVDDIIGDVGDGAVAHAGLDVNEGERTPKGGAIAGHQELVVLLTIVRAGRHARPFDVIIGELGFHLALDELKALLDDIGIVILRQHVKLDFDLFAGRLFGLGFLRLLRSLRGFSLRGVSARRGRSGSLGTAGEQGHEHDKAENQSNESGLFHVNISFSSSGLNASVPGFSSIPGP